MDELTEKVKNFSPEAVGSIKMWASQNIPANWLICAGQSLGTEEYKELFAELGYQWGGAGNSFNLPDMRGNVPVGFKEGDPDFGEMDNEQRGEKAHTLTIEEIPSHRHDMWLQNRGKRFTGDGGADELNTGNTPTGYVGGGLSHNNLQPYIVVNYIIRVK